MRASCNTEEYKCLQKRQAPWQNVLNRAWGATCYTGHHSASCHHHTAPGVLKHHFHRHKFQPAGGTVYGTGYDPPNKLADSQKQQHFDTLHRLSQPSVNARLPSSQYSPYSRMKFPQRPVVTGTSLPHDTIQKP